VVCTYVIIAWRREEAGKVESCQTEGECKGDHREDEEETSGTEEEEGH